MDGLHNDDQSTPGADNDESYCLPERLEHAEARAEALTRQLDAIPPTLLIAQAEKRVLESRMEHLRQQLITLSQDHKEEAVNTFFLFGNFPIQLLLQELVRAENEAMLQLSERERKALQVQLHEQALTIHQLSLHIQLLQVQRMCFFLALKNHLMFRQAQELQANKSYTLRLK